MNKDVLAQVARRPFTLQQSLDAEGTYVGSVLPLTGSCEVSVSRGGITATILDSTGWEARALQSLPWGTVVEGGGLFRPMAAGRMIRREHYGHIDTAAGWKATEV